MNNEALKLLKNLIKIDTSAGKSNKEIVDYILSEIKNSMATITFQEIPNTSQYNLIVKISGEKSSKPLLFVGHTDTVPFTKSWSITKPLVPKLIGRKLFGLGANDMKGALVSMILAINNIKFKPKQDVYFVFSAEEESTSSGSKYFIKNSKLKNCNAIICEPSNDTIVNQQKSIVKIKITTFGKSMHTQFANFSTNTKFNAIYKASKIIHELYKYQEDVLEKDIDKNLDVSTFSVSTINGGIKDNVLPNKCDFVMTLRLLPNKIVNDEINKIKKLVYDLNKNVEVEVFYKEGAFFLDENHSLVKLVSSSYDSIVKTKIKVAGKKAWTEAALYDKIGDVLILGPGYSKNSHIDDEYIDISKVSLFAKIFEKIVGDYNG